MNNGPIYFLLVPVGLNDSGLDLPQLVAVVDANARVAFNTPGKSYILKVKYKITRFLKRLVKTFLDVAIMHRCTRVENPGEGVPDVFCQNP
jgi:hypothetical protein